MSPKLEPYSLFPRVYAMRRGISACHHYRVTTPLESLKRRFGIEPFYDTNKGAYHVSLLNEIDYTPIHLYYLTTGRELIYRNYVYKKQRQHHLGFRSPATIFDADDNVNHISIFNPKYVTLGTRAPSGEKLQPGATISVDFEDGTSLDLWEDGKTYGGETFDIKRNIQNNNLIWLMAKSVDLVTVTTAFLAEEFLKKGCKKVYVYPNSLTRSDYPPIRPWRSRNPTILWQGGQSHWEDWIWIRDAIREVAHRRPRARFIVWGSEFEGVHKVIPARQYTHIPWEGYERYTYRLATIGHHINLCPLADNRFNNAKSAIKWYESSGLHYPAATLAANVGPYGEIIDGATGRLYNTPEEFTEKLIEMIDDLGACEKMAKQAHDWVWTYRDADVTGRMLANTYMELLKDG